MWFSRLVIPSYWASPVVTRTKNSFIKLWTAISIIFSDNIQFRWRQNSKLKSTLKSTKTQAKKTFANNNLQKTYVNYNQSTLSIPSVHRYIVPNITQTFHWPSQEQEDHSKPPWSDASLPRPIRCARHCWRRCTQMESLVIVPFQKLSKNTAMTKQRFNLYIKIYPQRKLWLMFFQYNIPQPVPL